MRTVFTSCHILFGWFYTPLGWTVPCSLHTTSLFSENTPSCKLSRAIHLKGSLTLPPDLSCLKYPELYMSSASPKSATLITESLSILSEWRVLSRLQTSYKLDIAICERTLQRLHTCSFLLPSLGEQSSVMPGNPSPWPLASTSWGGASALLQSEVRMSNLVDCFNRPYQNYLHLLMMITLTCIYDEIYAIVCSAWLACNTVHHNMLSGVRCLLLWFVARFNLK